VPPDPLAAPTGRRRGRLAAAGAICGLGGVVTVEVLTVHQPGYLPGRVGVLNLVMIWWLLALVAAACLLRAVPGRWARILIVGGAIVLQASAMTRGPQLSDDLYRYAWDARVQLAGVDPYRYPSVDPALNYLHDSWLWPSPADCVAIRRQAGCTRLNYPRAHTIYPPVAQAWFVAVDALPGPPREHKLQFYASLASLGVLALLMRALAAAGRDPRWAAFYAWSPIAGLDIASDAHVDVVAAVFALAAFALLRRRSAAGPSAVDDPAVDDPRPAGLTRRRAVAVGALLGGAVAVKLYPLLLLPAAARRRPVAVAGAAGGVVALSYLPHLFAVGTGAFGFLPTYLHVEGYDQGSRFLLLGWLGLSGTAAKAAAVAGLAAVALAVVAAGPERVPPMRGALWLLGTAFLLTTPTQTWYCVLLVVFAVVETRPEWLAVAAAGYPSYVSHFVHLPLGSLTLSQSCYGAAAGVVAAAAALRARARRPVVLPQPQTA
jgi:Glycosyltransferase family 87